MVICIPSISPEGPEGERTPSKEIRPLGGREKETSAPTGAADRAICCMQESRLPGALASFTAILLSERTREVRAAMISPMSIPR